MLIVLVRQDQSGGETPATSGAWAWTGMATVAGASASQRQCMVVSILSLIDIAREQRNLRIRRAMPPFYHAFGHM